MTPTRDKIAIIVGHAIVDGGGAAAAVIHVALGGPAELLGTMVEAPAVTAATAASIEVALLGGSEVSETRGVVVGRRYLLKIGRGGASSIPTQLSGERSLRPPRMIPPSAEPAARPKKLVLCGRVNLGSTDISCVGELSRSTTWLSEMTPPKGCVLLCSRQGPAEKSNARRYWQL